ncbi:hypothetical protein Mal4_39650 [Maioricimonas rarisocia]|uniref:Uncharacterized protein n=1 Tax=Maioricimonas rarisocia TaxID=2528026 RepID=A0A517ZB11_9PLAN|nr:hypothetical protein [Maioricimonas rarisocia]QDU39619.1 hypothetical protein Mal4_39650 [Maioricimonas rarisocia]
MTDAARTALQQLQQELDTGAEPQGSLRALIRSLLDAPAIGIDLDGCIDEAPEWFRTLSYVWPGNVYVITYRRDGEKARRDVAHFGVRCDEVILVDRFDAKATVIADRNISVYFDDQDEMLLHVPEGVTVLKIRNGGNFDFDERKWLFSDVTGRQI